MMKRSLGVAVLAVLLLAGCNQSSTTTSTTSTAGTSTPPAAHESTGTHMSEGQPAAGAASMVTTASGLQYQDIVLGDGATAQSGNTVTVHYTGWLTDSTKFDSSRDSGRPFSFVLGQGQVIRGWDEGVAGMKVHGRRKLVIPPHLGYGAQGAGGVIPPNATLVFDVELLDVH
jgi:FKBP-type peptidyl-prolyl cis-trans isomerase FkpA